MGHPIAKRRPLWICLIGLLLAPPAVADEPAPAEVLADRGLKRIGRVWILPQEIELRAALVELPKRHDRIAALERDLDARVAQNAAAWKESQPVVQGLKQALAKLRTDDPQRPLLEQQLQAIESTTFAPAKLGAQGNLRPQLIAWAAERNAQILAVQQVRAALPKLVDDYAALEQEDDVQRALRQAGDKQRLGPQRGYQAEAQKLAEFERLVHTPWTPIHWQAGQVRLTGLAAERAPVTFSFLESGSQPTLLTASAVETAGIEVPADAPAESVVLAAGRQVTTKRIEIPYLRFSGCVLRNVPALVLPPEAEDWGNRLGREALAGHSVRIEAERFRLWIDEPAAPR
jgi:hypothetical protein